MPGWFMWVKVEPTQSQIEMNIGKFGKNLNLIVYQDKSRSRLT